MSDDAGSESPQNRYYERYAQSTGSAPGAPAPRKGAPRWWLFAAAGLVVVLAIVVVVVFGALRSGGGRSPTSGATASVPTSGGPSQPSGQFSSAATAVNGALSVRPVVPGWQGVGGVVNASTKIYGAYDAPPGWEVSQSRSIRYKNGTGPAGRHTDWGVAAYNVGKCDGHPGVMQAHASFIDIGKRDPAEAVGSLLISFGSAVSMNADETTNAAQGAVTLSDTTVANGSLPATRGKLVATQGTLSDDCGTGKTHTLHGVAFTTNGRSVMLLIGVATWAGKQAPDDATINKIIASLRPAGD